MIPCLVVWMLVVVIVENRGVLQQSSPEELGAFIKSDIARIEKLIKDAGIGTR